MERNCEVFFFLVCCILSSGDTTSVTGFSSELCFSIFMVTTLFPCKSLTGLIFLGVTVLQNLFHLQALMWLQKSCSSSIMCRCVVDLLQTSTGTLVAPTVYVID
jgi:hypothetical protein